jgi:hypothetical protein
MEPSCLNCRFFVRVKYGQYPKAHCLKHTVKRNSDGYLMYMQLPGNLDGNFTQSCSEFVERYVCPTCHREISEK